MNNEEVYLKDTKIIELELNPEVGFKKTVTGILINVLVGNNFRVPEKEI